MSKHRQPYRSSKPEDATTESGQREDRQPSTPHHLGKDRSPCSRRRTRNITRAREDAPQSEVRQNDAADQKLRQALNNTTQEARRHAGRPPARPAKHDRQPEVPRGRADPSPHASDGDAQTTQRRRAEARMKRNQSTQHEAKTHSRESC